MLRDPILNALAENLQGIRDADQLRTNQVTLTIAVQQAAANQGISQDQLEQILRRVSDHHGEGLAQQLLARLGPGPPPPPGAAERASFGTATDPMIQDAAVGDPTPMRDAGVDARRAMRDASVEARRAMRDASAEARRAMRDASVDARSGSPVAMQTGGGDSPPPPPWLGSLLTRRTGMSSTMRNPVSFVLPPPAPPDDPPFGLPAPMYTGRPPPPPPPSAGFVTTGGPPPPPGGNFGFAPTPVRQDVPPGEQLPIIAVSYTHLTLPTKA